MHPLFLSILQYSASCNAVSPLNGQLGEIRIFAAMKQFMPGTKRSEYRPFPGRALDKSSVVEKLKSRQTGAEGGLCFKIGYRDVCRFQKSTKNSDTNARRSIEIMEKFENFQRNKRYLFPW